MKYFDKENNRLVFVEQKATSDYWDGLWNADCQKTTMMTLRYSLVSRITKRFLPKGSRVLEGGCGKGQYVYALKKDGYDVYGVDLAVQTVEKINIFFPDLQVSVADVAKLPFTDNFFDGYWSLGVIEHFYNGYDEVLKEMKRVVKDGGYVFLTFPHMSRLRRIKSQLGNYRSFIKDETDVKDFYQFALDEEKVLKIFENSGFILQKAKHFDGVKGLKDEVVWLNFPLQILYNSCNPVARYLRYAISYIFSILSSHSILLVFKLRKIIK